MAVVKILSGHVSPETAYLVEDYPYGFRLRCKIRYWLEYKAKKGVRFWSQTTNPKRGDTWNTPKASTFGRFGGAMFLDENDHVHWSALSEYGEADEVRAWIETYGAGVPAGEATEVMHRWLAARIAYEEKRATGASMAEAGAAGAVAFAKAEVKS